MLPWLPHFKGSIYMAATPYLLASSMISLEIIANLEVGLGVASKGVLSISHFIKIHPATVVLQHSDRQTRMVSLSLSLSLSLPPSLPVHKCRDNATCAVMATWTDSLLYISRQKPNVDGHFVLLGLRVSCLLFISTSYLACPLFISSLLYPFLKIGCYFTTRTWLYCGATEMYEYI